MAFSSFLPEIASPSHRCSRKALLCSDNLPHQWRSSFAAILALSRSSICRAKGGPIRGGYQWRLDVNAMASSRVLDPHVNGNTSNLASIDIPVTCYQIIGVPDKAEKDQIVKSVMDLKNTEVEEGYTMEAVACRWDLLMDVRDKLLFEQEYAGNVKEKIPPKSSLRIPWGWLPGALCLLQEVGEEKLVLEIGLSALRYPDAKPYIHDLLLSMTLAECAIAKAHFEKSQVYQGFEALARAQCLLRSKVSLGKLKLLSEIEESLEGLAPACTLELLAMPQTPDNADCRCGAIAALRELLRQGLDGEASCQVHDWPCFLSQALGKLMAAEIVDLVPWDSLASIRKNKKSLESQNQRVVIDFDCFYTVLMAHIAFGFSSRQTVLISKAKSICECLMASDGIDLKPEEAFCMFLLGQGNEAEALEMLRRLGSYRNQASRNAVLGKEDNDAVAVDCSLEKWLKDAVLCLFSDTRDCSTSLRRFFGHEKKAIGNKQSKGVSHTKPNLNNRIISAAVSSERIASDEHLASLVSSQHLGPAVKQLASTNLISPLLEAKTGSQGDMSTPSPQLMRDLSGHHGKVVAKWMVQGHLVGHVAFATVLGCIVFATSKILGRRSGRLTEYSSANKETSWTICSSHQDCLGIQDINYSVASGMKQLLSSLKMSVSNPLSYRDKPKSHVTASLSSPRSVVCSRVMPVEEAEALVREWQVIKAEALGPDHQIHLLFDILDDPMLLEWQILADAAKSKSCFWRFVLLQLSILRADILSDTMGSEKAEIEVLLEEAAELVDGDQQKNPNYYSAYRIKYLLRRQGDGSWKFCKAHIDAPP